MFRRLQVKNYKCFKYLDISLSQLSVLIGPNGSGKSTFFDIFNLLNDVITEKSIILGFDNFDELLWYKDEKSIELAFEIELPQGISQKYGFLRYELAISLDENDVIIISFENLFGISYHNYIDYNQLYIKGFDNETIVVHKNDEKIGNNWKTLIKKFDDGKAYYRNETDKNFPLYFKIKPYASYLSNLPEDETQFPSALYLKKLLSQKIKEINLISEKLKMPCKANEDILLKQDGSNFVKTLLYLKNNSPDNFKLWENHIKTGIVDIKKILFREMEFDRSKFIEIEFKSGHIISSRHLSDGTLRFLVLTMIPYLQKSDIYLIEEPENGLHPAAIESVVQSLSSTYESQILIATHSPIFLNSIDPNNLMIFNKEEEGYCTIVKGNNHPILKEWQRDISLGNLFASEVLQL